MLLERLHKALKDANKQLHRAEEHTRQLSSANAALREKLAAERTARQVWFGRATKRKGQLAEMVRKLKQLKDLVAFYRDALKDAQIASRADATDPEIKQ